MTEDIRWQQRFDNFQRSLKQLDAAVELMAERDLSELEEQGVIQAFEYNYEMAWNVIKDFYNYQGVSDIQGSRDAFRTAINRGLVDNGQHWMDMIKTRQLTSHTYKQELVETVLEDIVHKFYPALSALRARLIDQLEKDD